MPNAQYQIERDGGFIGMESRTNPVLLKEQYLQYAQNIRLERGIASRRKGMRRMANGPISGNTLVASGKYVTKDGVEKIVVIATDGLFLYNADSDTYSAKFVFPTGRTVSASDSITVVQAVNKLYIHRGLPDLTKFFSELVYNNSGNDVVVTTYTDENRTTPANHGYATNNEITVTGSADAHFNGSWVITVTSPSTFTYTLAESHPSKTENCFSQRAKCALVFNGVDIEPVPQGIDQGSSANMPPTDTAIYQSNRMVLKVNRDSIAVSDFLDFNTFDLTYGQFTINLGSYDELIGFTPWLDNEFIIFQRNSIYKGRIVNEQFVTGESPDNQSYITSISNAFGCVGRRAMVNTGRYVFFLSDGGIYMLEPQLDLKAINTLEPLSSPINDILLEYNRDYLSAAHGVFFDNRLFMALPVGKDANGNPHTRPNKVFIFNILNKSWESVDTYPIRTASEPNSFDFYVDEFVVSNFNNKKRLFIVNYGGGRAVTPPYGGIFLCEEIQTGDQTEIGGNPFLPFSLVADDLATPENEAAPILDSSGVTVYPTESKMRTRRFTFGTLSEKRFSSIQTDLVFSTAGAVSTSVSVYNPDRDVVVDVYASGAEPDATRRTTVHQRGYAIEAEYKLITGRPSVRGVTVDATQTGRNLVSKD